MQPAHDEGKAASREVLSELLRMHVTRGIGFLTDRRQLNGIGDMLKIAS